CKHHTDVSSITNSEVPIPTASSRVAQVLLPGRRQQKARIADPGKVLSMRTSRLFSCSIGLILLYGCCFQAQISQQVEQAPAPAGPVNPASEAAATNASKETEKPAKAEEPAAPRTLLQALCAYWRRLRSHPCSPCHEEQKNGPESASSEAAAKKSGPEGAGKENKKDDKSEPDKERNDEGKGKEKKAGGEESKDNGKDKQEKDETKNKTEEPRVKWFSAHAQATMDTQAHSNFSPPYTGPNSLLPHEPAATSLTATLFLDARLWECGCYSGELVFNPELAGGRGLSNVNGLAGFPNGDITRVGVVEPTPYFARLFLRQTWGMGGEQEEVEDVPNQIAGKRDVDRL